MRIVVTGRKGQVVRSLVERAGMHPGIDIVALGRPDLDLTEPARARRAIVATDPDIVVSAAAYTAVDAAEHEPEHARLVNETGARAVAEAAHVCRVPVIHLSTDYVFSGKFDGRHREDMPTDPCSVYGRAKLAGEHAVWEANPQAVILRSAWVYSPFGRNFVRTMLKLAGEREAVSVVDDQIGNPTSALDIADAIIAIARRFSHDGAPTGTYHYVGRGDVTWCGFARHVMAESARLGGPSAMVHPIRTADYPTAALRPRNSRLDTSKIAADFGIEAVDWRTSAAAVVRRLLATKGAHGTMMPKSGNRFSDDIML